MRFAILAFPGSNCELDAYYAVSDVFHEEAELVSYEADSLIDFDAVIVPGGFSYGDYLRSGAIARLHRLFQRYNNLRKVENQLLVSVMVFKFLQKRVFYQVPCKKILLLNLCVEINS